MARKQVTTKSNATHNPQQKNNDENLEALADALDPKIIALSFVNEVDGEDVPTLLVKGTSEVDKPILGLAKDNKYGEFELAVLGDGKNVQLVDHDNTVQGTLERLDRLQEPESDSPYWQFFGKIGTSKVVMWQGAGRNSRMRVKHHINKMAGLSPSEKLKYMQEQARKRAAKKQG